MRKPYQGVLNIIRFNWHFYFLAFLVVCLLYGLSILFSETIQALVFLLIITSISFVAISLLISYYIYDVSDLYLLKWLPDLNRKKALNINAGLDETSQIIKDKYPDVDLTICDFYNPARHTEVSIKRARKAYPPIEGTLQVSTTKMPFEAAHFDYILVILSAHEIRDQSEREKFFSELYRITTSEGRIFVLEHLRDGRNFMAYTLGALHFLTRASWLKTFKASNLKLIKEFNITPFITAFILTRDGDAL